MRGTPTCSRYKCSCIRDAAEISLNNKANLATCRKFKIPDHQNGQVYLTSHRICYVDNGDPRKNSTAIDLKDVERYEFYVRPTDRQGSGSSIC